MGFFPFVCNKGRNFCWKKAKREAPQVGEYSVQSFSSSPIADPGGFSVVWSSQALCLQWHSFSLGGLGIQHVREALTAFPVTPKIQLLKNSKSLGELLYLIQQILVFRSASQAWSVRPEITFFLRQEVYLPRSLEILKLLLSVSTCHERRNLKLSKKRNLVSDGTLYPASRRLFYAVDIGLVESVFRR